MKVNNVKFLDRRFLIDEIHPRKLEEFRQLKKIQRICELEHSDTFESAPHSPGPVFGGQVTFLFTNFNSGR